MKMYGDFQKGQYQEKNLRFGVREHGMGAIANGIALHNPGMIPYCATFFNFTDYMRGAIRMSALSRVSCCQYHCQGPHSVGLTILISGSCTASLALIQSFLPSVSQSVIPGLTLHSSI